MSLVVVPACGHLPQRISISIPINQDYETSGYINLRKLRFDDKVLPTRLEGMLIFVGGGIQCIDPKEIAPNLNFNHRASFALVHTPGEDIKVISEPIEIPSHKGFQYNIQGIQVAILPYIGEEDPTKILAHLRLASILLNCDLTIKSVGTSAFPISTLEIIPLGPQDNLKPYGLAV